MAAQCQIIQDPDARCKNYYDVQEFEEYDVVTNSEGRDILDLKGEPSSAIFPGNDMVVKFKASNGVIKCISNDQLYDIINSQQVGPEGHYKINNTPPGIDCTLTNAQVQAINDRWQRDHPELRPKHQAGIQAFVEQQFPPLFLQLLNRFTHPWYFTFTQLIHPLLKSPVNRTLVDVMGLSDAAAQDDTIEWLQSVAALYTTEDTLIGWLDNVFRSFIILSSPDLQVGRLNAYEKLTQYWQAYLHNTNPMLSHFDTVEDLIRYWLSLPFTRMDLRFRSGNLGLDTQSSAYNFLESEVSLWHGEMREDLAWYHQWRQGTDLHEILGADGRPVEFEDTKAYEAYLDTKSPPLGLYTRINRPGDLNRFYDQFFGANKNASVVQECLQIIYAQQQDHFLQTFPTLQTWLGHLSRISIQSRRRELQLLTYNWVISKTMKINSESLLEINSLPLGNSNQATENVQAFVDRVKREGRHPLIVITPNKQTYGLTREYGYFDLTPPMQRPVFPCKLGPQIQNISVSNPDTTSGFISIRVFDTNFYIPQPQLLALSLARPFSDGIDAIHNLLVYFQLVHTGAKITVPNDQQVCETTLEVYHLMPWETRF